MGSWSIVGHHAPAVLGVAAMATSLLISDGMERFTTTTSPESWNRSDLWTIAAALILPFGWVLLIPKVLRFLR
jgi:hypothetical protein